MNRVQSLILLASLGIAQSEVIYDMSSPNENVTGTLKIDDDGVISYQVKLGSEIVIPFSRIGFELANGEYPESSLFDNWAMSGLMPFYSMPREEWSPVWGEQSVIKDHYNQLTLRASQSRPVRRQAMINLRVYDIGVAFNMEFPQQDSLVDAPLLGDRSEFKLLGDHRAWWAPADYDAQDYNFVESKLSEISTLIDSAIAGDATLEAGSPVGASTVQTPITLLTEEGIYISIHEAGGDVFPSMNLRYDAEAMTLKAHLTPDSAGETGSSGVLSGPISTPWRSIMVTRNPAEILTSYMIYNLNQEPLVADTTWIQPVKSLGIWWELVTGEKTWHYTDEVDSVEIGVTDYTQLAPNHRHGATTERIVHYINFAAARGFDAVSFEGWNEGWENWVGAAPNDVIFDFVQSYPDVDESAILQAAAAANVTLIKHHEVGAAIADYHLKAPSALEHTANLKGYSAVKVGYHGGAQRRAHHTSQSVNSHYVSVIEEALRNKLSISIHGGLKPTGLARKYPNLFSATVGRTNAHAGVKLSPSHATVLPWNHLIGSPIEYGAGIVNRRNFFSEHHAAGTLARQIALLVVLYAPNQLIADTPDNLMSHLPLVAILSALPSTWTQTLYLEAEIGRFISVARQAPVSGDWFIGGVSSTNGPRAVSVALDFLEDNTLYFGTIVSDAQNVEHPEAYTMRSSVVSKGDIIELITSDNGGFVCHLVKQSVGERANTDI